MINKYKRLTSEEWDKEVLKLAEYYFEFNPCGRCHYPTLERYKCVHCGCSGTGNCATCINPCKNKDN